MNISRSRFNRINNNNSLSSNDSHSRHNIQFRILYQSQNHPHLKKKKNSSKRSPKTESRHPAKIRDLDLCPYLTNNPCAVDMDIGIWNIQISTPEVGNLSLNNFSIVKVCAGKYSMYIKVSQ